MSLLLLLAPAVLAPSVEGLISLDRKVQAAMVADDAVSLSRDLAADFRFTHFGGEVQTKRDVVRTAATKQGDYVSRDVLHPVAELHGNVGLVLGSLNVVSGRTKPVCYALNYVHLFVWHAGRWQMVSHRTTEMTMPPAPCEGQR